MNNLAKSKISEEIEFKRYDGEICCTHCTVNLTKQLEVLYNVLGKPNKLTKRFISKFVSKYLEETLSIYYNSDGEVEDLRQNFICDIPQLLDCIYTDTISNILIGSIYLVDEHLKEIVNYIKEQILDSIGNIPNNGYYVYVVSEKGETTVDLFGECTININWMVKDKGKKKTICRERPYKNIDISSHYYAFSKGLENLGFNFSDFAVNRIVQYLFRIHHEKLSTENVNIIGEYYDEINDLFMEHFSEFIDLINNKDMHSYRINPAPIYTSTLDTPRNLYIDYSYK